MMRRFTARQLFTIAAISLCVGAWSSDSLAENRSRGRNADDLLTDVLQSEATGTVANRGEVLESVLKASPTHAPGRWQAGYVLSGEQWVKFNRLLGVATDQEVLKRYRNLRNRTANTFDGRMELADWCAKHRLLDRERVHLSEALQLQPQSVPVLKRLGYSLVGRSWLSQREMQVLKDERRDQAVAFQKWGPRLQKIREGLTASSNRKRRLAKRELMSIVDPAAVDVIERTLLGDSETLELIAIESLANISAYQAAHVLADLAIESDNLWIRKAAIRELRSKPHEQFIPVMLSRLSMPTETDIEMRFENNRAFIRRAYRSEGQYRHRATLVDTQIIFPEATRTMVTLNESSGQRFAEHFSRKLRIESQERNKHIKQLNERTFSALKAITNAGLPSEPEHWWSWWNQQQDMTVPSKPWEYSYQQDYHRVVQPRLSLKTASCLRAGTPVWTEDGLVAVETIQAGDRVLAKNVETGELAYKPVLRPTTRPEQQLKRLELDGETIICTAGHPFWISGRGWTMVKEFQPEAPLHTVIGSVPVRSVSAGPSEKVYNLIVADFHTYFVGRSKILSHDNTLREPTNNIVPGLTARSR